MAIVLAAALLAAAAPARARPAPESFADLAEKLLPTVVNVATSQVVETRRSKEFQQFFKEFLERRGGQMPPERRRVNSLGSGFIIDPSGFIVTNNHVIAEADEISVRLADDTLLDAKVVGRDEKTDLALLKVESDKPLPAAKWGDSDKARIGDWVIAIGNPFGLGGTVTAGIISARQRDINSGPYDEFIQTDAAINRGNSGGPLLDSSGRVIGINTAIFSPSGTNIGVGFSVPVDTIKRVLPELMELGRYRHPYLGIRYAYAITPGLAQSLGLPVVSGLLLVRLDQGSPLDRAGVRGAQKEAILGNRRVYIGGDILSAVDGTPILTVEQLQLLQEQHPIGSEVTVSLLRDGQPFEVTVALTEEPAR